MNYISELTEDEIRALMQRHLQEDVFDYTFSIESQNLCTLNIQNIRNRQRSGACALSYNLVCQRKKQLTYIELSLSREIFSVFSHSYNDYMDEFVFKKLKAIRIPSKEEADYTIYDYEAVYKQINESKYFLETK